MSGSASGNAPTAPPAIAIRVCILDRLPAGALANYLGLGDESLCDGDGKKRRRRGRRNYHNDEDATAYLSRGDMSTLVERWGASVFQKGEGKLCRLVRRIGQSDEGTTAAGGASGGGEGDVEESTGGGGRNLLWAPLILRILPDDDDAAGADARAQSEAAWDAAAAAKAPPAHPDTAHAAALAIFVPPCLAATLGLHGFGSPHASGLAHLQPLPRARVAVASRATLREVGMPPPVPRPRWPSTRNGGEGGMGNGENGSNDDGNDDGTVSEGAEEGALRRYFLAPPRRRRDDHSNDNTNEGRDFSPAGRRKHRLPSRPRRRLLVRGSILAVPSPQSDGRCRESYVDDGGGRGGERRIARDVRFYQVVDVASAGRATEGGNHDDAAAAKHDTEGNAAHVVSPSTHLTLLPPAADDGRSNKAPHPPRQDLPFPEGRARRLPRPSMALSFLRSVAAASATHDDCAATTPVPGSQSPSMELTTSGGRVRHPSAKALADALYLRGAVPAARSSAVGCPACRRGAGAPAVSTVPANDDGGLHIVHVVGREENDLRACVDEAADIAGMRSFHVDGLAAFHAHRGLFGAHSAAHPLPAPHHRRTTAPLTGGWADKLRGLAAALDVARRSAPCVLHVSLEGELSPAEGRVADVDARRGEEQRLLEAIREGTRSADAGHRRPFASVGAVGMDVNAGGRVAQDAFLSMATTPRVIVVLSASRALPPGPIASSLVQRSIAVLPPDANYARALWDDDADGTFGPLSPHLTGLSAREIRQLRGQFAPLWRAETARGTSEADASAPAERPRRSPVDVLRSLLPRLEAARAFARPSSGEGGGASALPLSSSSLPNVRWEDIGGLESIRREIVDAVELPLKHPDLFEGSRRSGILLFGPPGTGKTLVAKAVARECGLPFLSIKGPELLGSYVGESEANVRAVFEAARSAAMDPPTSSLKEGLAEGSGGYTGASVLFFDELDSLAPRRGETAHGDGVMDRVSATLLGELDGGNQHSANVVVIGATNRPDLLDPSLLRPGRFDRLLYLGPAKTKEHCLQILLAQTRKFRFDEGQDAATVLEQAMESFPPTLSGADLSAVASGALMRGLKRVCERVEEEARSINLQRGADSNPVDVDDVMDTWSKEDLQPVMTAEDFVAAARDIVPSISEKDLESFEQLQLQFSSGQYL